MTKKTIISEDEKKEFRNAVRNIRPLHQTKVSPIQSTSKPRPTQSREETFEFYETEPHSVVKGEDLIQFSRSGIQNKVLRKLRLGQYNIEATIDLHGMRVEEARINLSDFLDRCQRNNMRHVLIIHGKGHESVPILKNKVNQWLRQTSEVLAFSSATARQGRGGALYVLLKRR